MNLNSMNAWYIIQLCNVLNKNNLKSFVSGLGWGLIGYLILIPIVLGIYLVPIYLFYGYICQIQYNSKFEE